MAWINRPKSNRNNEDRRKERQKIYQDSRWQKLRVIKLQKDPCCQVCGSIDNLQVHHIISMFNGYYSPQEYDRLAFDINNLCTLCQDCHKKVHDGEINLYDYL